MTNKLKLLALSIFLLSLSGVYFLVKVMVNKQINQNETGIPRIALLIPDNKSLATMSQYRLGSEQAALDYNCDIVYLTYRSDLNETIDIIKQNKVDAIFSILSESKTQNVWQHTPKELVKMQPDVELTQQRVNNLYQELSSQLQATNNYLLPSQTPSLVEEKLYQQLSKGNKLKILATIDDVAKVNPNAHVIVMDSDDLVTLVSLLAPSKNINLIGMGGSNQAAYYIQEGRIEKLLVEDQFSEGYQNIQQVYAKLTKESFIPKEIQQKWVTQDSIYQEDVQHLLFFD